MKTITNTSQDKSIKYYRNKLKMRQSDLAEKLGIKSYLMSFIENKKLYPDSDLAQNLAFALGVPIGQIYSEEELNLIIYKNTGGRASNTPKK